MAQTFEQFNQRLSALVRSGAMGKAIENAARILALEGQRQAVFYTRTNGLKVRSGNLRSSIRGEARLTGKKAEVILSVSGAPYAKTHEQKGRLGTKVTITPKRSKYLAIPIGPAKTLAQHGRVPGPRSMQGQLAFVQSLKGQPLLVHVDTGEPWFLLRRSVTIPSRPFMKPALDHIAGQAPTVLGSELRRLLDNRL